MKSGGSLRTSLLLALLLCSCGDGPAQPDPGVGNGDGVEVGNPDSELNGGQMPVDGISQGEDGAIWDPLTEAQVIVRVVHDTSGAPVPGVGLILYWQVEGEALGRVRAFTQEDGSFGYSVDAPVFITHVETVSTASAAQYGPGQASVKRFMQPGESTEVEIRLQDAAVFSGRVIEDDGTPVVGARILGYRHDRWEIESMNGVEAIASGTTNAEGRFRIGGMAGGRFLLTALVDGKIAVARPAGVNRPGAEIKNIEIVMSAAHTVFGQVLALDGTPVAQAEVSVGEPKRRVNFTESATEGLVYLPPRQWVVATDQDGNFTLPLVPDAEAWNISVVHSAFLRFFGKIEADTSVVTVELDPGLTLRLQVSDAEGKAITAGRAVYLGKTNRRVNIGADGSLELAGLAEDADACLYLHSPGYAATVMWPLEVSGGDAAEVVLLTAAPIAGQVLDAAGNPLPDTRVRLRGLDLMPAELAANYPGLPPEQVFQLDQTLTDSEGRFHCGGLYGGRFELEFEAPDGRTTSREAEAGSRDLNVVFE